MHVTRMSLSALGIALFLAGSSAVAQTSAPSEMRNDSIWTLERVRARAVEASPKVQLARAFANSAEALRTFSTVPIVGNPIVSIRAMVGVPSDPAAVYGFYVGLPFDVSSRRAAHQREANATIQQMGRRLAVETNLARAEAEAAFVDAQSAIASEETAKSMAESSRELVARMRVRVQAQASTELELSMLEVEMAQDEADVQAARANKAEAFSRLRQALDLDPDQELKLATQDAPSLPEGVRRETVEQLALHTRQEPSAARMGARRADLEAERWVASSVAPVTVGAEFEIQGNTRPQSSVGLSASWQIPVVQTNQGERAVARAEARRSEGEAGVLERVIAREVVGAFETFEARSLELKVLTERAVPSAERAMTQTRTLFESGATDSYRLLLVRRDLVRLLTRRIETMRRAWQARVALDRAIGTPQAELGE